MCVAPDKITNAGAGLLSRLSLLELRAALLKHERDFALIR